MTPEELKLQSQNLIKLFFLYLILSLGSLISGIYEYFIIQKTLLFEGDFSYYKNLLTTLQTIINILRGITSLFLAFYFIRWFFYSYKFLHSRKEIYYLSHKPLSAIYSWFIPVINLILPFLIMRENYEAWKNIHSDNDDYRSQPVLIWWILLILTVIADYFGVGVLEGLNSPNPERYLSNPYPFIIPGIIEILSITVSLSLCRKFENFYNVFLSKNSKITKN